MNKKEVHIDNSQYNKEIDEAIARIQAGDYFTQREVGKILNNGNVRNNKKHLQELEKKSRASISTRSTSPRN
jgi:hypothetical protein